MSVSEAMVIRCKRCGAHKPPEAFRDYYGSSSKPSPFCRQCESIDMRRRYLQRKGEGMTPDERNELHDIERLYELRRAAGLKVPNARASHRGRVTRDIYAELTERESESHSDN